MGLFEGITAGASGSLGTLYIRLTANATDLIKGMDQAVTSVDKSSAIMGKRLMNLGITAAAAFAAVGAASVREFALFESSFAGVRKTVDAGENTFVKLSDSFRKMSREMPTNVNEINKVAEAAGALGIKTQDIEGFTKTMIMMGTTTNLSAESAANEMARFANITGMSQKDFDRLGSTLFGLGKKLASTESEIMTMGLRIASAGTQVGMSEHQILALAGALSSVGVEAEMGGTAISQLIIKMTRSISEGSQELDHFAEMAGMSADQFSTAFRDNAGQAILTFLKGLNKLSKEGADVYGMLDEMGVEGIRMTDAVNRAALAQDYFTRALGIGKKAWEENTELTKGAQERYGTFASQITITWNQIKDFMITIGEGLVPALKLLNEEFQAFMKQGDGTNTQIKEMAQNFGSGLYAAIKSVITIVGGVRDAFRVTSIAIASMAEIALRSWSGILKTIKAIIDGVTNGIIGAMNLVHRAINKTVSMIPKKLLDMTPLQGMGNKIVDEIEYKMDLKMPDLDSLADIAKGVREEIWGELVASHSDASNVVKQTTAETAAAVKKTTDEASKGIKNMARESDVAINYSKLHDERMMKKFQSMPSADSVMNSGPSKYSDPMLADAAQLEREKMEAQEHLSILQEMSDKKVRLKQEERDKLEALQVAYNDKMRRLHQAEMEIAIISAKNMFGDLSSIAEAFAGKQSGIYKAMFAASKAFAIAESIIKIQQGIAGAAALPWPANLAAIASVVAATANIVSTIQAVKLEFGGKRERGGPVGRGKAYVVGEKGEEVFVPENNGTIIPNDMLGESRGSNVRVIINNYTDAKPEVVEREEGGERIIEISVRRAKHEIASEILEGRGPVAKSMEKSFGLRRGNASV